MTARAGLRSTPRPRDELREQLRTLGLVLRVPALVVAVPAAALTLLVILGVVESGTRVDFHPELSMLPGVAGVMLPQAVWWGEDRFGAGFPWTLPFDRRRHAVARVGAGWIWLMAAVLLFVLWMLALALITGGRVGADETVRLLPAAPFPFQAAVDPAAVRSVRWSPDPLLWLAPFTAATGTYLLASALVVGVRHPLRWIAGAALGFFLVLGAVEGARAVALRLALTRGLNAVLYGPWGVDALLTARTESLHTVAPLTTGGTVEGWRALPATGQWAAATLLWTLIGLAALWAAARRHRERRAG